MPARLAPGCNATRGGQARRLFPLAGFVENRGISTACHMHRSKSEALGQESTMSDMALPGSIEPALRKGPDLDKGFHPLTGIIYMGVVAAALLFVAYSIYSDIDATGTRVTSYLPYLMLFVALLIALGFEFVNGFHDTANAV